VDLKLITPEKILFSGDVEMVTVPGTEGVFGVLPSHAPFISTLKAGLVIIDLPDNTQKCMVVLSGIAEVTPERMILLAETAEDCSGLTAADAQARLQSAKSELDAAISEEQKKEMAQKLVIVETLAQGLKAA